MIYLTLKRPNDGDICTNLTFNKVKCKYSDCYPAAMHLEVFQQPRIAMIFTPSSPLL